METRVSVGPGREQPMRAVLRGKRERLRALVNRERGHGASVSLGGGRSALRLSVERAENRAAFTCPA